MKKRLLILLTCCIVFATACTPSKNTSQNKEESLLKDKEELTLKLNESEEKIAVLTEELKQMEEKLKEQEEASEYFPIISNLTREFIQAHTTGDKEKIIGMLSDELILAERDNGLYVIDDSMEWLLYSNDRKTKMVDWVLQGHSYDRENKTMNIYTREFLENANGEPDSPPTFLVLTFKMVDDTWKISGLAFDV